MLWAVVLGLFSLNTWKAIEAFAFKDIESQSYLKNSYKIFKKDTASQKKILWIQNIYSYVLRTNTTATHSTFSGRLMTFITEEQNTYILHSNIVLAYICDTTKSTKKAWMYSSDEKREEREL